MAQQINLIDISLRPARQNLPPAALLAAVAVAALLLTTHFAWEKWALARELAQAVAPEPAATEPALSSSAQSQREAQLARREALRDLMRLQVSVAEGSATLLGDIIGAMPPTMWLSELEVGASRSLRLSGSSADSASFSQFTSRLEKIPALKSLPLHTVRLEPLVVEGSGAGQDQPTPAGRQFVLASGASGSSEDATAAPTSPSTPVAPVTAALAGVKP